MITLAAKQETGNDDIRPIINRTRKSYQNMVSRQLERSPLEERKVSSLVSDLHNYTIHYNIINETKIDKF